MAKALSSLKSAGELVLFSIYALAHSKHQFIAAVSVKEVKGVISPAQHSALLLRVLRERRGEEGAWRHQLCLVGAVLGSVWPFVPSKIS